MTACGNPWCSQLVAYPERFCLEHRPPRADFRPSPTARGYGPLWRRIRIIVLSRAGIPRAEWPRWDVDHTPAYDPAVEPDHLRYKLTPRRHGEHSAKTAREDGGFGHQRGG